MSLEGGYIFRYIHPYHGVITVENRLVSDYTEFCDDYDLLVSTKIIQFTSDGVGRVNEIESVLNSLGTKKVTKIKIPVNLRNMFDSACLASISNKHIFMTRIQDDKQVETKKTELKSNLENTRDIQITEE